ncbi:isoleucine--tRNA ligase [Candidatus Woesearchaeota archaeon]|nr:MAG: isoleucine--tRNA ligase [Candidatus Woesearchaeota archaeon]
MYEFKKTEESVLKFWEDNNIYKKAVEKNKGKKKFYFLQGPPYTSGRLHIAHAWNNSLKDIMLRYKRMKGFDVWDRAGYDMHGLPTAKKVMAEHNLKTKEDIQKFGVEKFINECINFSKEKARIMDKDLWRVGIWMDYENAYWPIRNEYIESVWFLIKKADEKKRLYEGLRTMSWCPSCQTAMAKHECQYKEVEEDSIFVKFKLKGKDDEYILVWTTTPWTMAYNLAVMVNPELDYVKVDVGGEKWIIAKGLMAIFLNNYTDKKYHIVEEFKGEEMDGWEYVHPWHDKIPYFDELKQKYPKVHTVLLSSEYVNLGAGTGLVHCAPGCGPEDYEVGHRNNVPPFNNLKEDGTFPEEMGEFAGLKAKTDDKVFIQKLDEVGALIAVTKVEHDYAHCERCHSPVVFRATKQWFFKTEDIKDKMLDMNKDVLWVPESGKNAFDSWLDNLRDNSITKQRFWGTPVPIWKCECGNYVVVSSRKEMQELNAKNVPENLHKPWIDEVKIPCKKCGKDMTRLPDVLDVWIDAGCASWACLEYPHRKDLFERLYPADFILEAREQVRGWFNLLMVASTLAFDNASFKNVYMHGMLTDIEGQKMSKSLGNVISPYELIDKYGADTLRFYMCRTNAGEDIKFSWEEAKLKYKNLSILWNLHSYLIEYANNLNINAKEFDVEQEFDVEELYMLSKLNSTIKDVTNLYENYKIDDVPKLIEDLFLELSRTYVQIIRDKVVLKPKVVLTTLFKVLYETVKMLATISPFISEKIYLNLKDKFGLEKESVHLLEWPEADESLIDKKLEKDFEIVQNVVQAVLAAREKAGISVRWPLKEAVVLTKDDAAWEAVESLKNLVMLQTNVKDVVLMPTMKGATLQITPNKGQIGKDFKQDSPKILNELNDEIMKKINEEGKAYIGDFELTEKHINVTETLPENLVASDFRYGNVQINTEITKELEQEGFAREVTRRIQEMRKQQGLTRDDKIEVSIVSNYDLSNWGKEIKTKVGAVALYFEDKGFEVSNEVEIKGENFKLALRTL